MASNLNAKPVCKSTKPREPKTAANKGVMQNLAFGAPPPVTQDQNVKPALTKRAAVKKARSVAPVPQNAVVLKTARTAAEKRADPLPKPAAKASVNLPNQHNARTTKELIEILGKFPGTSKWSTQLVRGKDYINVHNRVGRIVASIAVVK